MTMGRTIDRPLRKRRANQNKSTAATTATTTILGLPAFIIWDILSRLPLRSIGWCKIVCKTWCDLLLDPYFAKLHHSRSPISLIVHNITCTHFGIFELDDIAHLHHSRAMVKFRTKIKIPNGRLQKVNSCNGLLCLFDLHGDTVIVCNPISGKNIIIPKFPNVDRKRQFSIAYDFDDFGHSFDIKYAFGHSPSTDQYKVLRFVMTSASDSEFDCDVYTIGCDDAWRSTGATTPKPGNVVFLNGALHWLAVGNSNWLLYYFDVEKEQFGSFSLPSLMRNLSPFLGVVDNCFCICDDPILCTRIWVMKNYLDIGSLTLEWSFEKPLPSWTVGGPIRPIKTLKDGTLLLISGRILVSYNPKTGVIKKICYHRDQLWDEVVIGIPSFFSLMDAAN
ncbi:hypothetical protein U1Q18_024429 [Sarracenia purpurea var. burkii]